MATNKQDVFDGTAVAKDDKKLLNTVRRVTSAEGETYPWTKEDVKGMRYELQELGEQVKSLQKILSFVKKQNVATENQTRQLTKEEIEIRVEFQQLKDRIYSKKEDQKKTYAHAEMDIVSSHLVNLSDIQDMVVMKETGLIVVSTWQGFLFQFSLQGGRLIEKQVNPPCEHDVYLLCVQVAGKECLALSCDGCRDIKLLNLSKQSEVITAFSGERVYNMCQGEENRIFVLSGDDVLELDTSTTTFTKLKSIHTDLSAFRNNLCYVSDPHRLLVVSDWDEVRAMSCDDNEVVWRVTKSEDLSPRHSLYISGHNAILVADWVKNRVVVMDLSSPIQRQTIQLPDYVCEIKCLCLFKDTIIVASTKRKNVHFILLSRVNDAAMRPLISVNIFEGNSHDCTQHGFLFRVSGTSLRATATSFS